MKKDGQNKTTTPVPIAQPDDFGLGRCFDRLHTVTIDYVTHQLAGFAAVLQHNLEVRLDQAEECNAAILLSELCEYWGLSDEQRAQVLGPEATRYVKLLEADHLTLEEALVSFEALDAKATM